MITERSVSAEAIAKAAQLTEVFKKWGVDVVACDFDDTLIGTRALFYQAFVDIGSLFEDATEGRIAASQIKDEMLNVIIHDLRPEFGVHPAISEMTVLTCARLVGLSPSSDVVERAVERIKDVYRKDVPEIFEGAVETIGLLNATNARVVLMTHAAEEWTWHKRVSTGLVGKFDRVHCFSVVRNKAVQWEEKLREARIDPKYLLVVGDNKDSDILPPVRMGAMGVWVTNGGRAVFSLDHTTEEHPFDQTVMEAESIKVVPEVIIKHGLGF